MAKKNKNKTKKVNPKKERYAKFKKEKPSAIDVSFPDLDSEQQKQKREDEEKMGRFFRFSRNPIPKEVKERRMVSKRDRVGK